MDISRINGGMPTTPTQTPKNTPSEEAGKKTSSLASDNRDGFEKSEVGYTPAYTKGNVAKNKADSNANDDVKNQDTTTYSKKTKGMKGVAIGSTRQYKNSLMTDMVNKTISGQKSKSTDAMTELKNIINGTSTTDSTDEDYWGAEATANRILDFAKNLAGDDKKLISTLKDAFKKGFNLAANGDKKNLPQVCSDTYDLVMKGFDDWEKGDTATEETAKADKTE